MDKAAESLSQASSTVQQVWVTWVTSEDALATTKKILATHLKLLRLLYMGARMKREWIREIWVFITQWLSIRNLVIKFKKLSLQLKIQIKLLIDISPKIVSEVLATDPNLEVIFKRMLPMLQESHLLVRPQPRARTICSKDRDYQELEVTHRLV